MRVKYMSSFLTDLQRIDNRIVIDKYGINGGSGNLDPVIIYDNVSEVLYVYVESGITECGSLEFYYDGKKAFTLSESTGNILLNPQKTLFELKFPNKPKATIENIGETIIETPGTDLGYSLYKNIEVSNESLVWKESIGKYVAEKGQTEDKDYNVEVSDTLSGQYKTRSFKFKSYQNLIIEQGYWDIDTITTPRTEREDVFSDISYDSFLYWDSPLSDSKVEDETPICYVNFDMYLNPGEVVFGNDDYLQYIKYSLDSQQEFKGLRVYGSSGSVVEARFNRSYENGPYKSFTTTIGEKGYEDIIVEGLDFYHLNGVVASGPCKVSRIETIINRDNIVEYMSPNPDKTYVAHVGNENGEISIHGSADYIEYENYLGEIKEIGRGTDSIENISKIKIDRVDGTSTGWSIDAFLKKIRYTKTTLSEFVYTYSTYSVSISDNLVVKDNEVVTEKITADYKVKIKQEGITWKNIVIPDYVNNDSRNIYVLDYKSGSTKTLRFISNIDVIEGSRLTIRNNDPTGIIRVSSPSIGGDILYEGEYWRYFDIDLTTTSENTLNTWRPSTGGQNPSPYSVEITYDGVLLGYLTFYVIQRMKIVPGLEIWEETFPGQYTPISSSLIIYNSIVKNFLVVKRVGSISYNDNQVWYYRDLTNLNKFFLSDINSTETISGSIYYLTSQEESSINNVLKLSDTARDKYVRVVNVMRSDYIDNIGVLTITESAAKPESWRNLINQSTINVDVFRELTNVYVKVGTSEDNALNEDFELVVDQIGIYSIYIVTNFKYIIKVNEEGYLRLINSSNQLYTEEKVMSGYNGTRNYHLALTRLDELDNLLKSEIEITSGTVKRKITIKLSDNLITTNSYYGTGTSSKRVRIKERGAVSLENERFEYISSTTPNIVFNNFSGTINSSSALFTYSKYLNHLTSLNITIPNSNVLSNQKYPIKSFGNIEEKSLSYSSLENNSLTYYYYMKGLGHRLWYSETLFDFSDIENQGNRVAVVLDSASGDGRDAYVVSRYSADNRTFRSEYPTLDVNNERGDLKFTFDIQSWGKLGTPDPSTQIEYYLPIKISSNYTNAGGNIYLGSLKFKSTTKITEDSIPNIIEISDSLIEEEGINATYIKNNIINDSTSELELQIFQAGSNPNTFSMYSGLVEWYSVDKITQYIIPEIGKNVKVTNISISQSGSNFTVNSEEIDSDLGKFITVRVDIKDRVEHNTWYGVSETSNIRSVANDLSNSINIVMTTSSTSKTFSYGFHQAGYNRGLIIGNYCGVGHDEEPDLIYNSNVKIIDIVSTGGMVNLHAGIADIIDGSISSTEFLAKPFKYYFVGEEPLSCTWEDGNMNDSGNLLITFRSRGKYEEGNHDYLMVVEEPDELRPLKLYVIFRQSATQSNYSLSFDSDLIGVYSDGSIAQGVDENGRIHFTSNINSELFKDVVFTLSTTIKNPDDLSQIMEEERYFMDCKGYVKIKFRPNGSKTYVNTTLKAMLNGVQIGSTSVQIGYQCLSAYFCIDNETHAETNTKYLSRINFTLVPTYDGNEIEKTARLPSRAQNDNGTSVNVSSTKKYIFHRGVFHINLERREFGESQPVEIDLKENPKKVEAELMYMSDESIFENTGIDYISKSYADNDASGIENPVNYSNYNPYLEFTYRVKEDFVNVSSYVTASARITVTNDYTLIPATYYLSTFFIKSAGNELTETGKFNIDGKGGTGENIELVFDYHSGVIKSIPYSPITLFNSISVQHDDGSEWEKEDEKIRNSWMEIDNNTPGIITFKPLSSAITERFSEVKIDLVDERVLPNTIINSNIIKLKQTAMPISLSTNTVSLYEKTKAVTVKLFPTDGLRSSSISISITKEIDCTWLSAGIGTEDNKTNITLRANTDIEPDEEGRFNNRSTSVKVVINYSSIPSSKYYGEAEQVIYVTQYAPSVTQITTAEEASLPMHIINESPIDVNVTGEELATKSDISDAEENIIAAIEASSQEEES